MVQQDFSTSLEKIFIIGWMKNQSNNIISETRRTIPLMY